jgi:tetratricopeptide (TPR) repeat protein
MYSYGFTQLQNDFTVFNPQTTGLAAVDVMTYYYYAGYICTALKQYEKAIEAFRLALSQPTFILHACLIHAYQKFLLVSLLAGKNAVIPKAASEIVKGVIPNAVKEYKELYNAMISVKQRIITWVEKPSRTQNGIRKIQRCVLEGQELCMKSLKLFLNRIW